MASTRVNRLRVAYVIQNVGGIDLSSTVGDAVPVRYTLHGLRKVGHRVRCLALSGRSVTVFEDIERLDRVCQVPLGLSGSRPFLFFESGVRRLQRELHLPYFAFFDSYRFYEACLRSLPGYTLCHEHNGLFCAGAALASSRLKIPYLLTFSADPLLELALVGRPLRGIHKQIATWETQLSLSIARKILCVSEAARQHLVEQWKVPPEKIVVMPNGVDPELFHPGWDARPIRQRLKLGDAPVVGFVGGFQPWHGIDSLVESFATVQRDCRDARLLLVGDGPARRTIERKVSNLGLDGSVIITGLVPQSQVPTFLAAIDIAVLPYPPLPTELWFSPLKLYEYMASGRAIVASRAGQIAEVIEDGTNGMLVRPGDVQDLTEAIRTLLADPEKRGNLGRQARRKAVERHSWNQYIERLEEVYLSVL